MLMTSKQMVWLTDMTTDLQNTTGLKHKDVKLSVNTMDVLFWMLDESKLMNLKEKSEKVLLTAFGSIAAAREYRSAVEAQQFTLSYISANLAANEGASQTL